MKHNQEAMQLSDLQINQFQGIQKMQNLTLAILIAGSNVGKARQHLHFVPLAHALLKAICFDLLPNTKWLWTNDHIQLT
jgi:hypothetical protein